MSENSQETWLNAQKNWFTQQRIDGRKRAEELLSLADIKIESRPLQEGFARAMREYADGIFGDPVEKVVRVMADSEAIEFEAEHVGFGKYKDDPYGSVDIDYLAWIADKNLRLQAYLRSDRAKQRLNK